MTLITYPYHPQEGDPEDISQIMADFEAVRAVVNGALDDSNISAGAAIALSKLGQGGASTGQGVVWNGSAWAPASLASAGILIFHQQFTSDVNIPAHTQGTATQVVALPSRTYDGNPVIIEFYYQRITMANPPASLHIILKRDATVIADAWSFVQNPVGAGGMIHSGGLLRYHESPPAGAHTYTVAAYCDSGTAVIGAGPGNGSANAPGYLRSQKDL